MRLFIAAELPADIQDALTDNLSELPDLVQGKPVPPENLHLTLAFIGEVEDSRVQAAKDCMQRACSGQPAIGAQLDDYGFFGAPGKAHLYQAVESEGQLEELAARVRSQLALAGMPANEKPFRAHITLMRNAKLDGVTLPMPFTGEGPITRITLFASTLGGARAAYTPLASTLLTSENAHATHGPTLFVDADACPVTPETLACARKAKVPVVIAGNATQNLLKHVRKGDPQTPGPGFWVSTLEAPMGSDSADFCIIEQLAPNDMVVTQDIGLAAMALGRGAAAIGVRGRIYSKESIDAQLLVRHEEKKVRRAGGRTGGPQAFTNQDRARFCRNLERLISQAKEAASHAE